MKTLVLADRQRKRPHRRGLTLIELVLVLVILIALAGLLVPMFGNVTGMTHGSGGAANIEEVVRSLQFHKATNGGYPNELDLLLNDHSEAASLAPLGGTIAAAELTTAAMTDRIADALEEAGITQVIENPGTLEEEEDQTTFGSAGAAANDGSRIVNVDGAAPSPGNVVVLGVDAIARLGLDPVNAVEGPVQYVVLGIGNNNDGVGRSMVEAPVHFRSNGGSNEDAYSRLLAVFRIPADEGGAILSSVVAADVHDGAVEIAGLGQHIREYHHAREQ